MGFSAFRDIDPIAKKARPRKSNGSSGEAMAEDSEEDDDDVKIVGKLEDLDEKVDKNLLSPEDVKHQGELAEGVGRINVSHHTPSHRI